MKAILTILTDCMNSDFKVDHEKSRVGFLINPTVEGFKTDETVHSIIRHMDEAIEILKDIDTGIQCLQKVKIQLEKEMFERT